jgi:hypothetical protein
VLKMYTQKPSVKPGSLRLPHQPSRRFDLEQTLCQAIRDRAQVEMTYKTELAVRVVEPYAVFHSPKDATKVCLSCNQIRNFGDPFDKLGPRDFEVRLIGTLRVTDTKFVPDPRFFHTSAKHRNSIICSV